MVLLALDSISLTIHPFKGGHYKSMTYSVNLCNAAKILSYNQGHTVYTFKGLVLPSPLDSWPVVEGVGDLNTINRLPR